MKGILTTALLLTGITFGLNNTASADSIDDLAFTLDRQVRALNAEFARNYRHTPSYRHLMSDTNQMLRLADHIHDVAHDGGNVVHLQADVRQLDKLFHHLEDLVADMSDRGHGHDDLHGHGHRHDDRHGDVRGPDTRRARILLASIEDTIHHLHADLQDIIRHHHAPAYPKQGTAYPGRGPNNRFGNDNFNRGNYNRGSYNRDYYRP